MISILVKNNEVYLIVNLIFTCAPALVSSTISTQCHRSLRLFWHQHLNLNKIQIVGYIPKFTQCHYVHFALWPLQSHLDTLIFHKSQKLVTMVSLVPCVTISFATTMTITVYMVNIVFQ